MGCRDVQALRCVLDPKVFRSAALNVVKSSTPSGESLTRKSLKLLLPALRRATNLKLSLAYAPLAQLAEHALRKRMVVGSIPTGGLAVTSVSYLLILSSEASVPYAATCFDGYSCSCLVWFLGAPVV